MARRHVRPMSRAPASVRRYNAKVASTIRSFGWQITYVGGGSCAVGGCRCNAGEDVAPSFAYTVGLTDFDHPEFLIFGVSQEIAREALNALGEAVRGGARFEAGYRGGFDEWDFRFTLEEVPNPGEIVFVANEYYRREPSESVPVLQLTYDDENGRFPWEEGYATPELQPRPGTFRA